MSFAQFLLFWLFLDFLQVEEFSLVVEGDESGFLRMEELEHDQAE